MNPITTARLILREFAHDDFDDVYRYESDPEVVKYVSYGPYTPEECRQDLAMQVANQHSEPRRYFHLAVTLHGTDRAVGWCGLQFEENKMFEAELGYALHRDFWGKGFMTEAARAMVDHAFSEMGVHRVWGECCPENVGSVRVLQKLGMTQEAHLRENRHFKGRWWDTLIFGILTREWRAEMDNQGLLDVNPLL